MARKIAFTIGTMSKAAPYVRALRAVGLEPDCFTEKQDPGSLDGYAGLVLGGGRDVDPSLYGEAPHPEAELAGTPRDEMERRLLDEALKRHLPVLAICRGMQLVNVHLKGSLHQHIDGHRLVRHAVSIEPGTLLERAAGAGEYEVHSRHHQAVKKLGKGLRVTASAPDGTIESVEHDGASFLLAVQWHPEDGFDESPHDRRIFTSFAEQIR